MKTSMLFGLLLATACGAGTPGANPTDMGRDDHQAEARRHDQEAAEHAAQYDAGATAEATKCVNRPVGDIPCWTTVANPTQAHLDEAERHRKMAADHRGGSKALADAEARACSGLAQEDRDSSPFDHREDVASVNDVRIRDAALSGGGPQDKLKGASITLRAVPGLTKEYLQRLVTCHLARNASMGFAMPEMAACPLSVKGATATVEAAGGALRVDVTSDDLTAATEISRRARALGAKER